MSYRDTHQKTPEWLAFREWMDIRYPGWAGGKGHFWDELSYESIENSWEAFLAGTKLGPSDRGEGKK